MVRALAKNGFDLALLARGKAGLEGAAKDVAQAGGRAWYCLPMSPSTTRSTTRRLGPRMSWAHLRSAAPDRPSSLFGPVDADVDHGARGAFGERAQGVLDGQFMRSLPKTGRQLAGAVAAAAREKLRRLRPSGT